MCVGSTVFDAYRKLSGCDIEDSVEGETSGNLENLLLAVGKNNIGLSFLLKRTLCWNTIYFHEEVGRAEA